MKIDDRSLTRLLSPVVDYGQTMVEHRPREAVAADRPIAIVAVQEAGAVVVVHKVAQQVRVRVRLFLLCGEERSEVAHVSAAFGREGRVGCSFPPDLGASEVLDDWKVQQASERALRHCELEEGGGGRRGEHGGAGRKLDEQQGERRSGKNLTPTTHLDISAQRSMQHTEFLEA